MLVVGPVMYHSHLQCLPSLGPFLGLHCHWSIHPTHPGLVHCQMHSLVKSLLLFPISSQWGHQRFHVSSAHGGYESQQIVMADGSSLGPLVHLPSISIVPFNCLLSLQAPGLSQGLLYCVGTSVCCHRSTPIHTNRTDRDSRCHPFNQEWQGKGSDLVVETSSWQ